jgi:hypothetical protein
MIHFCTGGFSQELTNSWRVMRRSNLHTKLDVYLLLQIQVIHFSANHIPSTCTTSSAAREGKTRSVCGTCKRKLEHVQICFCTQVCLTQHPSNTLRIFLELNCCTLYKMQCYINPLNAQLNPTCHLLALSAAHHILHSSR